MNHDRLNSESIQKTLGVGTKKSGKRRWVWLGALLVAVGAAAYFFMGSSGNKKVEYVTAPAEKKELVITVSATGNLEPTNTVEVGIEVSGTVSEVYADYNQRVKKGDILARLDTTKLESRVKNSHAALLVAKANLSESNVALNDAKKELARGTGMYESTKGNFPSEKEMDALRNAYDRAIASHDAAVARVAQADAQLKSDQDDLKKAVVVSPFDGIVLSRAIDPGQTVAASLQTPVLFTLAEDLTKMEVVVSVDEADVGQVTEGQKVSFTVDAYPGKTFDGAITQVRLNSVIVSGVVTYETVVSVENSELLLRPGMTASADIITKVIPDALTVPNTALRFMPPGKTAEGIKNGVWVLDGKKQPKRIEVTTAESDGIVTAVENGLTEGTQVITGTKVMP